MLEVIYENNSVIKLTFLSPHFIQVTGQTVLVDVGEDRLLVEAPKNLLDICVPVSLDSKNAKAYFITSSRVSIVKSDSYSIF